MQVNAPLRALDELELDSRGAAVRSREKRLDDASDERAREALDVASERGGGERLQRAEQAREEKELLRRGAPGERRGRAV